MSKLDTDCATLLLTANPFWNTVYRDYELKARYGMPIARAQAARQVLKADGHMDNSNMLTEEGLLAKQALEENLPMSDRDGAALMYLANCSQWSQTADNASMPGCTNGQVVRSINNLIRLGLATKISHSDLTEYNLTDFGRKITADMAS